MQLVVKLFGPVREAAGVREFCVALPEGARVQDLRDLLARDHPIFDQLGDRLAAAVNFNVVSHDAVLRDGDEVAFLPPVAGGSSVCRISDQPLDVGAVVAKVSGSGMGGIVTFLGAVRDEARGRAIQHLEYEAYAGMAEREMDKIVAEVAERWPGTRLAIAHRVGHLAVGELAVVIAAAAPHRPEAFEACRYAIDTLKETVPIWKKEFATDGDCWVDEHP
jgi:molybdopterin converting factor subunit 1